jgi:hypothetical protein
MVGEAGSLGHVHMLGYSQVGPFVLTAARTKHKNNNILHYIFVLVDPDLEPKGYEPSNHVISSQRIISAQRAKIFGKAHLGSCSRYQVCVKT